METLAQPGLGFTLIAFALVVGILVFVHEYGHYGMARLFGIKVETFSVGFGRPLFGWTDRHGTRWQLGWLPLGGYAKFAGDMNAASQPDPALAALPADARAELFQFRPLWQRALVVAAGPAINFLFAILLFALFFMTFGQQVTPPVIGKVVPGTPAAEAGLQPGDRVIAVDGRTIRRFEDMTRVIAINPGQPVAMVIERNETVETVRVTPRVVREEDRFGNEFRRGLLGVQSGEVELVRRGPVMALWHGTVETWNTTRMMADTLVQIVTGRRALDELGGPIKIAQFSGQSASLGLAALVSFMALISINLGFINLLPIPMLDGGHLFLYAVEGLRRRPLHPKLQELAFVSGFALLISLMLFLTWNDLASIGLWDRLAN
jgi:regulator of sigma E protease